MAGAKIYASGGIQYANNTINAGFTRSLLSCMTNISSAVPGSGDKMSIYYNTDFGYIVNSGTYVGTYYINKNDPQGAIIWQNMNSGSFLFNDIHSYQHWTPDNYLSMNYNVNPPENFVFQVGCNGIKVYSNTWSGPGGGSFSPTAMASLPGSVGAFDVGSINTGWSTSFDISIARPMNPFYVVNVDVNDYYTGNSLYSNMFNLDATNGYSFIDNFAQNYWDVPYFNVNVS
jgi:hypothetical protein